MPDNAEDAVAQQRAKLIEWLGEETASKIQIEPKYIEPDPNSQYHSHQTGGWTVVYKIDGRTVENASELIDMYKNLHK